jgi:hypothetical protein
MSFGLKTNLPPHHGIETRLTFDILRHRKLKQETTMEAPPRYTSGNQAQLPGRRIWLKSAAATLAFKTYYNVRDPEEIQRRADAEIPLEKVYGDWPVGTDPEAHIKTITDLFSSGATIVNIHSGQADQKRVIDFYGKEVLPRIKRISESRT